jgi:AcrR family transcriptional regulator
MKQDGRAFRGQLIKEEVREKILKGYIELLRAGTPFPTATQIAQQARVSRRVVFNHFTDLAELRAVALNRIEARSYSFQRPPRNDLSARQRLRVFIEQQTTLFEEIAPFRRLALMIEDIDPLASKIMKRVRARAVKDIEEAVRPALCRLSAAEKKALVLSLHTICSWPSWETLRSHRGLSRAAACTLMTDSALAILSSAIRRR